ncbi:alpha/beta fold hydrolase [Leptospira wolffii]|uniref:Alpha/beta fold hydrolase n=1 Tax=Leptospira wolffii TaxID=409998 RepID=A0ABV5BKY2_9LEPT|nr:alpha/beta fold hydrolase [Leptospira wolffii]TGK60065.1 alpha/beta fold hydrolase [Leptospira wolffii]TGK72408.1 alpha/beta fold hydrolase [Leptospira wolffii]TGK76072.1 alpha/beta fold hydrolase [Leptospira wolffii]TGL30324.1 alpha/beta fold hydrolase [Leptospira wolffii]TGL46463.1 alpha/beta fold hydrolase [Leptospira wolffii]
MDQTLPRKVNPKARRKGGAYSVGSEDIYIFPLSDATNLFLQKVWNAFVNKMVAMALPNGKPVFQYSVFEAIQGKNLKIVASSTHFRMKEVANRIGLQSIEEFIRNTIPISIQDPDNLSAKYLREAILSVEKKSRPEVYFHSLDDERVHPNLKQLLTKTMNYAAGIPLFVKGFPIGMLWGIRRDNMTPEQEEEVRQQLYSLYDVVDFVISKEMGVKGDPYYARKNIEKSDLHSRAKHLFYTRGFGQSEPVTTIVFDSHTYQRSYRLDASYLIPSGDGFSVSIKRFEPKERNDTGKNLLLIPGFFCRRSVMDKVARELCLKHGYRVFSMDMRGRSRRTLPTFGIREGWTVDDFIQEDFPAVLAWLRDNFPNEKLVVVGHSMGGMIPRFYSSAYEEILKQKPNSPVPLPRPDDYISGIVSITSPNFIRLQAQIPGLDVLKMGLKLLPSKTISDFLFDLTSFSLQTTLPTVDLNKFFKFLLGLHSSLRAVSFDLHAKVVNLRDFVGYKQISPPEWYFLIEDIFCEESTKVVLQFLRSQLGQDLSFLSYDGTLDYTALQKNLKIPLLSVLGSLDKVVPSETIQEDLAALPHKKNKIISYEQGHLGIVFHMPVVREMCSEIDGWIRGLDST